jgi:peptidoglycan/LPS O-acetylase OafA/YrhL
MDNLRVAVIAGVIVMHVATAYILDISWYYEERTASGVAEALLAVLFLPTSLFAMAVLFLVAGMLTARSMAHKGAAGFWRDRLLRLGAPVVIFILVLDPATSVLGSWGSGDYGDLATLVRYEFTHPGSGPMWFVVALLVFSLTYGLWRRFRPVPTSGHRPLRRRHLLTAVVIIVLATFVVRLVWPFTGDTPLALNLWEWPQMAALFALGTLAQERGWLDPPPPWLPRLCLRAGVLATIAVLAVGVPMAASDNPGPFLGGWHLQALAEPVCEATIAVSMSFWMALWFAHHVTYHGRLARALGRASYTSYVLHAPVIVALSVALSGVAAAAEVKFVTVAVLGVAASYLLGWLVTATPHRRQRGDHIHPQPAPIG